MANNRPKLKIPFDKTDIALELCSTLLLLTTFIMTLIAWVKLPEKMPIHFNLSGKVDGYGTKMNLLFVLLAMFLIDAGLTFLSKYPHLYNYVVEITERNAERQYKLAKRLVMVLKLEVAIIFSYLQLMIILSAKSAKTELGLGFLPLVIVVLLVTTGFYIYKSVKENKTI